MRRALSLTTLQSTPGSGIAAETPNPNVTEVMDRSFPPSSGPLTLSVSKLSHRTIRTDQQTSFTLGGGSGAPVPGTAWSPAARLLSGQFSVPDVPDTSLTVLEQQQSGFHRATGVGLYCGQSRTFHSNIFGEEHFVVNLGRAPDAKANLKSV